MYLRAKIIAGMVFLTFFFGVSEQEMTWIWTISEFVHKLRYRLRYGEESRAPLKFLRLELREDSAECEWLARANDPWDAHLPMEMREDNRTLQTLRDALRVREALFFSLPRVRQATVKVYRATECQTQELIITGFVCRDDYPPRVASLAMRAKLYGFRFRLEDGILRSLDMKPNEFAICG